MANGKLILKYGSADAYKALGTYDNDTLYFVDGVVYKGATPYGTKIEQVSTLPDAGSQGVLYLLPDKSFYFWDGSSWQVINVGMVGTIEDAETNDGKLVSQGAIKAYVTARISDMQAGDTKLEEAKTYTDEQIIAAKTELTTAIEEKDAVLDKKIDDTKTELQNTIDAKIASVFRFKGTKANIDELNAVADAVVGDVWHVTADGKEYVFVDVDGDTAGEWELLGFTVDLSAYSTTEQVNAAIEAAVAEVYAKTEVYTKDETDAAIKVVSDTLDEHKNDTDIHITADERTAWNAKADAIALSEHTDNGDIHVTKDQKVAWETHRENADIHVTAENKLEWDAKATTQDIENAKTELMGYADTAESDAVSAANTYTDTALTWQTI